MKKLPREVQGRIIARLTALADDPRPAGAELIQGKEGVYRVRLGQYRLLYQVEDAVLKILVVRVAHRKEVYQHMDRI